LATTSTAASETAASLLGARPEERDVTVALSRFLVVAREHGAKTRARSASASPAYRSPLSSSSFATLADRRPRAHFIPDDGDTAICGQDVSARVAPEDVERCPTCQVIAARMGAGSDN
jgi:hypothetical protein